VTDNPSEPSQSPSLEAAAGAVPAAPELSPAACAARLAELFPALFAPGTPKPLKLRIQSDIQLRAPGVFTKKSLSVFLHRHTTTTAYLRAVVNSPQRIDLDGAPAGAIADDHRQAAVAELERRRAMHEARREAERQAQRAANDEARRARAAEDEQRREASALLRAFEATTLTRANFCALKGLSEAQLDALLAQARQAPPPAPVQTAARANSQRDQRDHRGQGGPRPSEQPGARQRPHPSRRPAR
jgi:ProP effector